MVESRIRHLISKLEGVDNLYLAHPFVKGFDRVHHRAPEQEAKDVSHGISNLNPISEKSGTDSSKSVNENVGDTIYTTTFYIGLLVEPRAG
jgi:poly(A) polymerase